LVAAEVARRLRHELDLEAVALGVAYVHPQEVSGEQRRLLAAGPGAHLDEHVACVVLVLRQERGGELARQRVDACARRGALVVGELAQRRVARQLVGGGEVGLGLAVFGVQRDRRLDVGALLRQRAKRVAVTARLGSGEQRVDFGEARVELLEAGADRGFHRIASPTAACVPSSPRTRGSISDADTGDAIRTTEACVPSFPRKRESSSDAAMDDAIRKMMEVTTGSRIR